ncbi:hypothetical protein ACFV07_19460 [Streptomyces anulatus]|uniref:hypothetical protein n=1 Tax=Streptomyces anulatus TaxID=1892 RepID=UPI0036AFDC9F
MAMVPSSTGDDIIGQQQIKDGNANSSYTPNTGVAGIANKNNFHDNKVASILFAP